MYDRRWSYKNYFSDKSNAIEEKRMRTIVNIELCFIDGVNIEVAYILCGKIVFNAEIYHKKSRGIVLLLMVRSCDVYRRESAKLVGDGGAYMMQEIH